ncbi:MAG: VWA domain-containing protein [Saprospiraceae bacterium]
MFRFENPYESLWLISIALCVLLFIYLRKYSHYKTTFLGKSSTIKRLYEYTRSIRISYITTMMCVGLFFSVVALMNPQWGYHNKKVDTTSADVYIAIDLSNSMNATDVAPTRLEKAKQIAESIVQSSQGDRISLIYFAASAFMQMPLTNDYGTARMFIRSAQTNLISTQGTSISEAIRVGLRSNKTDNDGKKIMIIISDGEDHEEGIENVIQEAIDKGWIISTIGVGSVEGSMVPVEEDGRETYLFDDEGNPVSSKLNTEALKQISEKGHGKYFDATDLNINDELKTFLEKLDRKIVQSRSFSDLNSYYMYFLVPALLSFIAVFIMMYSYKNKQI